MNENLTKFQPMIPTIDEIKESIDVLEDLATQLAPEHLPDIHEISGLYGAYKLVNEKAIIEEVARRLGELAGDLLRDRMPLDIDLGTSVASSNNGDAVMSWKELITRFVSHMNDKGISAASVKIYRPKIKSLFEYEAGDVVSVRELIFKLEEHLHLIEIGEISFKDHNERAAIRHFLEFLKSLIAQ